ncbi:MAG TPA: hypothetical protein VE172_13350 [Stackebrandtia sp.]|uniref:hypothetical protein n=1 Tax=Stackebrandtia sp. TaxID=2023065 RepID=UPI002D2E3B54|nr:hypothetical protein [Stackebrandtia sp.]HZE39788.1 hypothetical protein [Stackebrandtia sp.]
MSKSTPGTVIGAGFGTAVAAALAQLGLASGLAIIMWRHGSSSEWAAHLSWAAWLAATATVVGGLVAGRLTDDLGIRVTSVLAAGIGGFVVAPLIAIPAMRFTEHGMATAPYAAAGIGALAGAIMAGLGLAWRALSINVLASVGLTWLLAVLGAFLPAGADSRDTVQLGVWASMQEAHLTPALWVGTLLIGVVTAWALSGTDSADQRVTAFSGAAGPLLLVAAYAVAGQSDVGVPAQWSGIGVSGGAVLAGLLGSLLVTALRRNPSAAAPSSDSPTETIAAVDNPPAPSELGSAPDEYGYGSPSSAPTEAVNPFVSANYDPYDTEALGEFAERRPSEATPPPPPPMPEPEPQPVPEPQPQPEPVSEPEPQPEPEPEATKPSPKPRKKSRFKKKPEPEPLFDSEPTEPDDTESWVSDLKDVNAFADREDEEPPAAEPEPKKKRRWGFGKKKDDE